MFDYYSIDGHDAPLLISVPHAGLVFPGRDDLRESVHRIADLYVDRVGQLISDSCNATLIRSNMSRLWCDIERYPDEREEMNKVGMGVIYDVDADMNPLYEHPISGNERRFRLQSLYWPYHDELVRQSQYMLNRYGYGLLLDLHSYSKTALPYELHKEDARPGICIGHNGDRYGEHVAEIFRKVLESAGYEVGFNQTFKGAVRPNGIDSPHLACVMIEIRKDQYLDDGKLDEEKTDRLTGILAQGIRASIK
ncbi:N-formylglutamate amidohydrolase [Bifidobacterium callitrichidarum]|uniref:N-formylglutamate amidohydrolase n=1 Tax=Bifidobacterium callitrichidarum TaxID=2052941 RepID=UPI001304F8D4|nr:N-formylglutamate amidohydrolase [Bifidobacterium callitrichidarum]